MIPYLFTVTLFILLFITVYKVFLQKETFFKINRGFLLAGLVLSFALPFVKLPVKKPSFVPAANQSPVIVAQNTSVIVNTLTTGNNVNKCPSAVRDKSEALPPLSSFERGGLLILYYIYWFGLIFFAVVFVFKILILLYHILKRSCITDGNYRIVEIDSRKGPCSFGHYIFINSKAYDVQTYKEILLHEKIHGRQMHGLDVLIVELSLIVLWFNPFAWLYRAEIKNNLEYLADDEVLRSGQIDKTHYQMSLLSVTSGRSLNIALNYNQSLLKKRILMINQEKSKSTKMLKYILLTPVLVLLLFVFDHPIVSSKSVEIQKNLNLLLMENKTDQSVRGHWEASFNGNEVDIKFKNDNKTLSNINFQKSEFNKRPSPENTDFSLFRDPGRIDFKGKFDQHHGSGEFTFTPDEQLAGYARELGIAANHQDMFTFCLLNLKIDLLRSLKAYSIPPISKDNVIFLAISGIDGQYVDMLKKEGYGNLDFQQIIAAKNAGISEQYLSEIGSANIKSLTFEQLLNFKLQHISGNYITGLTQAHGSEKSSQQLNADQILSRKALNVTPSYIVSMSELGYHNTNDEITQLAALKITPEFVRDFQKIGFEHIPFETLVMLKMSGMTPGFVESFKELGYGNESIEDYITLKNMNLDNIFIKDLDKMGYHHVSLRQAGFLKLNHVTPQYIAAMNKKGYSYTDLNQYIQLRNLEK